MKELISYYRETGSLLSTHKFQKACGPLRWTMVANADKMPLDDMSKLWQNPERGMIYPLGKALDLVTFRLKDKPGRIASITVAMTAFLKASVERGHGVFEILESQIGILQFVATTCPEIIPLLQPVIRCLHADTRFKSRGRCVWSNTATKAYEIIMKTIAPNLGIAFMADKSPIDFDNCVWIICDAAGASDEEPDSYRGGFSLIILPGAKTTLYTQRRWSATELIEHSTALECENGTQALRAALKELGPRGPVDIIECFDNTSTVGCRRRLACRSPSMCDPVRNHAVVCQQMIGKHRLFTTWFPRGDIQMADDGSKDLIEVVRAGLRARGLPPLAKHPLPI